METGEQTSLKRGFWLNLLLFALIFASPAFQASQTIEASSAISASGSRGSNLGWLLGFEFVVRILGSVYLGITLLHGKNWKTIQRVVLGLWIIGPIFLFVDFALYDSITGYGYRVAAETGSDMARMIIFSTVWTLYLLISSHVKELYRFADRYETNAEEFDVNRTTSASINSRFVGKRDLFISGVWMCSAALFLAIFDPFESYTFLDQDQDKLFVFGPSLLYLAAVYVYRRWIAVD